MPDTELNTDVRTNDELDLLADKTSEARNSERPMTEPPPKEEKVDTFEFTHGGKPVKATKDQMIKWAQMGYDRPQVIAKLNKEKTDWENQKQTWEKQWGHYKQIDDYAKQNSDWWNYIVNGWKARGTTVPSQTTLQYTGQTQQAGQVAQLPPEFTQKINLLEQNFTKQSEFINSIMQERQQQAEVQQDKELDSEIQTLRGKHSDLDWDSLDENGKNLEVKILEHAQSNGIPTFRAALRDMLFDDLVAKAESQGKIAVARGIQADTKLGVLGRTPTSAKYAPEKSRDIKNTSYEQLEQEIKEELRQARA